MSPPTQDYILQRIDDLQCHMDKQFRTMGERLAVVETKVETHRGGIKWIGALIAGGIGSAITLIGSWIKP